MTFTKIVPRRNQDLQKSYYCEVETYKNKVWAKLGLTKIRFGQSLDLQKTGWDQVGTYKNQVWAKSGLTKIKVRQSPDLQKNRFGRSRDLQKPWVVQGPWDSLR